MKGLWINRLQIGGGPAVTLHIEAGACAGLCGPSGSGKTRLLRAVCDLDKAQGEVALNSVERGRIPAPVWRTNVAFLPAESAWWHDRVGAHFRGDLPAALRDAFSFPKDVFLWDVQRLSSGEKQRLALLRALENRPAALLLDEPTAHLDDGHTEAAEAMIKDYRLQQGAPVLWVTHQIPLLERVADQQYIMQQGRITVREAGS